MKNLPVRCLFVFLLINLSVSSVFAFEDEHEAHEHGHATLMLVQEKNELQLLFKSPAMNITGFEHQANSHEQKEKVKWAIKSLSNTDNLFRMTPNAQCVLEHLDINSSLLAKNDHHEKEDYPDNDGHHGHDDHHEKDDHHATSHDDHHENKDSHSEFEVEYHFECANMSALKEMKTALFEVFTSIEALETQVITNSGQKLLELERHAASITF